VIVACVSEPGEGAGHRRGGLEPIRTKHRARAFPEGAGADGFSSSRPITTSHRKRAFTVISKAVNERSAFPSSSTIFRRDRSSICRSTP